MSPSSCSLTAEEIRSHTIENLTRLVTACKTSESGYRVASEQTLDLELKARFARLSRQRGDFARELRLAIRGIGGEAGEGDNEPAREHFTSTPAAPAIAPAPSALREAADALRACESAEGAAAAAYRAVLTDAPLESELRLIVSTQAAAVRGAHDQLRAERHA